MFSNFITGSGSIHRQLDKCTDDELISLIAKKDSQPALEVIFTRYIHLVFAVCMKFLKDTDQARDASMEIFESLQQKIKMNDITYFKSWLYVLVKNHCLMIIRKQKKVIHTSIDYADKVKFNDIPDNCNNKESDELKFNILLNCLSKLKNEQKVCLELMYLRNYCYNDISVKTGFSLNSVKSYIQNGKRNLKLMLESFNEFKEDKY